MASKGKTKTNNKQDKKTAYTRRRSNRRRGKRTLHYILVTAFLVAVGIVLSLTVFFPVKQVVVVGSEKYDPVELAAASGIKLEDNLLRVSQQSVRDALLPNYPYLESVSLHRVFPDKIELHVVQSRPVGAIAAGDEYFLIAGDGKVLDRGVLFLPADALLIQGIDAGDKQPGEYLGRWTPEPAAAGETEEERAARAARNQALEARAVDELEALGMLERLLDAMEITGFDSLTNLDLSDRTNMSSLYENRLLLQLGSETDLVYKLDWIAEVVLNRLPAHAKGTVHAEDVVRNPIQGRYTPAPGFDSYGNPKEGYTPPEEADEVDAE